MKTIRILKIKDFFALLLAIELAVIMLISPNEFKLEYLFAYLLPFGISSLVWNKRLYDALMDDNNALYAKSNISFGIFLWIGLFLVVLTVVAFATAIYRWTT